MSSKRIWPKKGDPDYEMYVKVKAWDTEMKCLPTWIEILELEYLRQTGKTNMYDINKVCALTHELGLTSAFAWVHRCIAANYPLHSAYNKGLSLHEPERGNRYEWITRSIKARFVEREYELREAQLRLQLSMIEDEKREALQSLTDDCER